MATTFHLGQHYLYWERFYNIINIVILCYREASFDVGTFFISMRLVPLSYSFALTTPKEATIDTVLCGIYKLAHQRASRKAQLLWTEHQKFLFTSISQISHFHSKSDIFESQLSKSI